MSAKTADLMKWHHTSPREEGKLSHPRDGQAWKHFDQMHHSFSIEPRNVRLGLASDGFCPWIVTMGNNPSIWPVVLIIYNLPSWLAMKQSYFMMSLLIDGLKSPGNNIDMYLQPLIDELKT